MTELLSQTTWAATLLLVAARVGGIFIVAPVFSTSALPIKLRAGMALVFAIGLLASVTPTAVPTDLWILAAAVACELAIGATIGYAVRLVFVGVQIGATQVGQQMGLSMAELYRGSDEQGPATLRRFLGLLAIVVFLAVGGHREVIVALRRTFSVVPLAGFAPAEGMLAMVVAVLGASFVLALKIAAPVLITLLLVTVAMGIVQRTVPQLNMFTVGIPVRLIVGLAVLALTLSVFAGLVEEAVGSVLTRINDWLGSVQ